jgi:hypothetical protein
MLQKLHGHWVNFSTLAIVGGLSWGGYLMQLRGTEMEAWQYLLGISIATSAFAALFNYQRLLVITEAPISTIAAAAQGYIELHGTASTQPLIKTPYHSIPCVWYRAWVYANRYDEETGKKDTRLLEYQESDQVFELKDGSGTCKVNPKGAEIISTEQRTRYKNDHRYVEEYLPTGKPLYVLGYLDTRKPQMAGDATRREISALLGSWKANPEKLLQRFDVNRDGKIDLQEWELARTQARQQVELQQQMRIDPLETFTLVKPPAGKLFLISVLSPQRLLSKHQCWSLVHFGVMMLLLIAYVKLAD